MLQTLCAITLVLFFSHSGMARKTVPFQGKIPGQQAKSQLHPKPTVAPCGLPNFKLPANAIVLAAGAYSGRTLDRQIDQSGHEATQMDVTVNHKQPVALMLGSYEPTIWNVGWTEKTNIIAVVISGYHRQVVAGLRPETPTLISSHDDKGPCEYFYLSSGAEMNKVNSVAQKVFGKTVDIAFSAKEGIVLVGTPLAASDKVVTSDWKTVESYFDKNSPLAGLAGLQDAVKKGLIRLANDADYPALTKEIEKEKNKGKTPATATKMVGFDNKKQIIRPMGPNGTYVVLKKFTYPAGLYGGNSAAFIIQKGVPEPDGDPGHSDVYDLNKSPICQGPMCGMDDE